MHNHHKQPSRVKYQYEGRSGPSGEWEIELQKGKGRQVDRRYVGVKAATEAEARAKAAEQYGKLYKGYKVAKARDLYG